MSSYAAVEVTEQRVFRIVQRERVQPGPGRVRVKVEACGVCHTDALAVEGMRADPSTPIVPGHEIVGVIEEIGPGAEPWRVGDRVGIGFLGGQCGKCDSCRRGDYVNCDQQPTTGTSVDGGYAEVTYAAANGLVRIPDGMAATDAPLLCAGLTSFVGLRRAAAAPGALVAVQGIGGLGHLALQYASKLGYRVAAVARGTAKEKLSRELGADFYIDSEAEDPGQALRALGGAAAVLATASHGGSMAPLVSGLAPNGHLVVLGAAADPIPVLTTDLIFGTRTISGSLTGSSIDNEDNLRFSHAAGVRPMTEVLPLAEAEAGYLRMMSGEARFRVVLDPTL
ncbi:alcohol dehydrogenase catalytic domain-containing protein [Streptomyces sp. NPDC059909]|uniref:alcohol dehydrogenase catalytic domain-containing protein n=1 Tax=Streptomyces sp. NPDC059909 TaxID=3346998 RepID=UPI00364CB741